MTPRQRWLLHVSVALVTISGVAFAVMKYLMVSTDPYSPVSHPLQPWALSLHVLSGPLALFAIGWIFREHIAGRRNQRNGGSKLTSGLLATGLLAPMVSSGYLLEVVTDETLKVGLVVVHLVSGGLFAVSYAIHVIRAAWSPVVLRVIVITALVLAISATLASGRPTSSACDGVERARQVMGSLACVVICDPHDEAEAAESASAALDVFDRVDRAMSLYRPDSDLSRLNRDGYPGPVTVDRELIELLALSVALSRETQGTFDVTIKPLMDHYAFYRELGSTAPAGGLAGALALVGSDGLVIDREAGTAAFKRRGMSIDLGGVAKGYALDRAAEALRERGVRRAFLDLGRSLMFVGPGPEPGGLWRAAIVDPVDPGRIATIVAVGPGALSTSSPSGRKAGATGHVLDPSRGAVNGGALQATVWSPSGMRSDALAKSMLLLDEAAGSAVLAERGEAAIVYRPSRRALSRSVRTIMGPIEIVGP